MLNLLGSMKINLLKYYKDCIERKVYVSSKIRNYSNKAVVQEEVLILTELLEDITKKHACPRDF